jgi:hypothetical protein
MKQIKTVIYPWSVDGAGFHSLRDAIRAARKASAGNNRSTISQPLRGGFASYPGTRAVVAHFYNGSNLQRLARGLK